MHRQDIEANNMRGTVMNICLVVVQTRRPGRTAEKRPANIIAFYCKGCRQMFFAAAEDAVDFHTAQEIAGFLMEGHRLEKVDAPTARRELNGCTCHRCLPAA